MIKVSTANFYVGNQRKEHAAAVLGSLNCHAAGVQEAHGGNVFAIKKVLGKSHAIHMGTNREGKTDVLNVIDKKKVKVLRHWKRQISARAEVKDIGMPRTAVITRFEYLGQKYTFINTHTNAGVQSRTTRKPLSMRIRRVAQFAKGTMVLEGIVRKAQLRGDIVIIVGDLNYRQQRGKGWKFSPQALFNRTRLDFITTGIDYVAFSKKLKLAKKEVIGMDKTGSDHPWLVVTLVKR
jgi:hypothetical protein